MKTVRAVLLVAALVIPAAARADEASDRAALARQVVDLAVAPGLEAQFGRVIGQAAERLPADKREQARAVIVQETAGLRTELEAVVATYYADTFTLAELKELVAFYSSPLGRKVLQAQDNQPEAVKAAFQQQFMKLMVLLQMATEPRR